MAFCPLPARPTVPQPLPVARWRSDRGTVRAVSPRGSRDLLLAVLCEVLCREVLLLALTRMPKKRRRPRGKRCAAAKRARTEKAAGSAASRSSAPHYEYSVGSAPHDEYVVGCVLEELLRAVEAVDDLAFRH
eukprot:COSAG01_NODE_2016_length_8641_cov_6.648911_7_plen_132_part_00